MSRPGSSSDSHRNCGGGPGSRRQWPRLDDDLGQDNSGGQNRSCGGIGLDQDRSGGENRSCGGSLAESPAPSNGSVVTSAPGDSEVSTDQEYYDSSDGKKRVQRRKARHVTVPQVAGAPRFTGYRSTRFNNRSDVGNVGFFFGNWGMRTQNMDGGVQLNIDAQITKNPGQVIGLTECEEGTEYRLNHPDIAQAELQGTEALQARDAYPYHTIRSNEKVGLLVGVRSAVADSIELLNYTRKLEGLYNSKGKKKQLKAYTRTLVAKITMKGNIGYIGRELRVAVCHLHFLVANYKKGFKKQHVDFWPWLADELKQHQVHVLMGDFNMSLFRVVPELRSRGVDAKLVSWFPWRSQETDDTMVDSCGIFVLVPADVTPSVKANIWTPDIWKDLPKFPMNAGPGQTIETYLPKDGRPEKKVFDSLQPVSMRIDEGNELAEDAPVGVRRVRDGLTLRGKTLEIEVWKYKGGNHKGAHFPLACWTKNEGNRSEEAFVRRGYRSTTRRFSKPQ